MQIEAMESKYLIIWIRFRTVWLMNSTEDLKYTRHASYKGTSRNHSWCTEESLTSGSLPCLPMSRTLRNQKVYWEDGFMRRATSERAAKISHSPRAKTSSFIWQMMQFRSNHKTMVNMKLETKSATRTLTKSWSRRRTWAFIARFFQRLKSALEMSSKLLEEIWSAKCARTTTVSNGLALTSCSTRTWIWVWSRWIQTHA